ncbi:9622_t:CDS:2, partial [Scutellospora calospora]
LPVHNVVNNKDLLDITTESSPVLIKAVEVRSHLREQDGIEISASTIRRILRSYEDETELECERVGDTIRERNREKSFEIKSKPSNLSFNQAHGCISSEIKFHYNQKVEQGLISELFEFIRNNDLYPYKFIYPAVYI